MLGWRECGNEVVLQVCLEHPASHSPSGLIISAPRPTGVSVLVCCTFLRLGHPFSTVDLDVLFRAPAPCNLSASFLGTLDLWAPSYQLHFSGHPDLEPWNDMELLSYSVRKAQQGWQI